jgi:predicted GIY-YIG superfamily endonuclease
MYHLYTLKDPITNIVRYVGYSKNPKRRLWEHLRDAKKGLKTYKSCWIKSLLDTQKVPIMEIIKVCESHEDILMEEMNLIKNLKEKNIRLTNLTDGGDGRNGVKLPSNHPFLNYNLGKKMSDDSRKKISDSRKGIIFTDEHKEKLSLKKIGVKRSMKSINKQVLTRSIKIEVIIGDEHHIFEKKKDAVKFTGVNANQIDKLIKENKKSKKGYLFKLYLDL